MSCSDRLLSSSAEACEADSVGQTATQTYCFSIDIVPDPGTLVRVLDQFAKRGLVPTRWHSDVVEVDTMQIDIQVIGLSDALGRDIARCLGSIVGVHGVLTARRSVSGKQRALTGSYAGL
jgi:acetolactate synthase regulatory subunit